MLQKTSVCWNEKLKKCVQDLNLIILMGLYCGEVMSTGS